MTETDKRYFIKRIKEIQEKLVENIPDNPKISFNEYKGKVVKEIENMYLNMNEVQSEQIIKNLMVKVQNKLLDTKYYGDHSYNFNHISVGVKQLIPEIESIQNKLDKVMKERNKEEAEIVKELTNVSNEICDHIRFDDIEEHYGKSIKEVMNDFRNFYANKKAA